MFELYFLATMVNSGTFTVQTAARIATDLTTGLLGPMFQQIDPLHVGETGRAMSIAQSYGRILQEKSNNIKGDGLDTLLSEYPSHGFVIDREEAGKLFHHVRGPNELEECLAQLLGDVSRVPLDATADRPVFEFLSDQSPTQQDEEHSDIGRADDESVEATEYQSDAALAEASTQPLPPSQTDGSRPAGRSEKKNGPARR